MGSGKGQQKRIKNQSANQINGVGFDVVKYTRPALDQAGNEIIRLGPGQLQCYGCEGYGWVEGYENASPYSNFMENIDDVIQVQETCPICEGKRKLLYPHSRMSPATDGFKNFLPKHMEDTFSGPKIINRSTLVNDLKTIIGGNDEELFGRLEATIVLWEDFYDRDADYLAESISATLQEYQDQKEGVNTEELGVPLFKREKERLDAQAEKERQARNEANGYEDIPF